VDDDAAVLSVVERLLAEWGFEVIPFGNFESARAFILTNPPLAALIVDIRLGEYNGLQLMHLAKQAQPGLNVIAMSGFDDDVLRQEAARIGAEYIVKPIELPRLRHFLLRSLPH
jgi:DNA-binding NtrC family response regulator